MTNTRAKRRRGEGHVEYVIITTLIMVCALVGLFSMIQNIKIIALERHICVECPAALDVNDLNTRIDDLRRSLRSPGLSTEERISLQAQLDEHVAERDRRAAAELAHHADDETDHDNHDDHPEAETSGVDEFGNDFDDSAGLWSSGIWDMISIFSGAPNFWSWMRGFWT